jgi:hypothetical protein
MSIKGFIGRQVARAGYLIERALVEVEKTADEGGVLPKLPPAKPDKRKGKP